MTVHSKPKLRSKAWDGYLSCKDMNTLPEHVFNVGFNIGWKQSRKWYLTKDEKKILTLSRILRDFDKLSPQFFERIEKIHNKIKESELLMTLNEEQNSQEAQK